VVRAVATVLAATAVLWIAAGCQRKAPGPLECERAALILTGVSDRRMLRDPEIKDIVDERTVECLTVPYDRALLDCFEQTGATKACVLAFQMRHHMQMPARRRRSLPHP
jgi:hypothetical protein